jgi:hypothetical protein
VAEPAQFSTAAPRQSRAAYEAIKVRATPSNLV